MLDQQKFSTDGLALVVSMIQITVERPAGAVSLKPQADFMGLASLKENLIQIEEAVKLNNFSMIEELFHSSLVKSIDSEIELKEMLGQF